MPVVVPLQFRIPVSHYVLSAGRVGSFDTRVAPLRARGPVTVLSTAYFKVAFKV